MHHSWRGSDRWMAGAHYLVASYPNSRSLRHGQVGHQGPPVGMAVEVSTPCLFHLYNRALARRRAGACQPQCSKGTRTRLRSAGDHRNDYDVVLHISIDGHPCRLGIREFAGRTTDGAISSSAGRGARSRNIFASVADGEMATNQAVQRAGRSGRSLSQCFLRPKADRNRSRSVSYMAPFPDQ